MKDFQKIGLIYENLNSEYSYINNCADYEDGNEVYDIVQQDDLSYGEDTYFHDPDLEVPHEQFKSSTGVKPDVQSFTGYNSYHDLYFEYKPDDDIHYFYGK